MTNQLMLLTEAIAAYCENHKAQIHYAGTIPTLEELTNKSAAILTTTCSAGILSAFGQEAKLFSICSSTGKSLLVFLRDIITAILCVAMFTD
jgi:hypothetical protein